MMIRRTIFILFMLAFTTSANAAGKAESLEEGIQQLATDISEQMKAKGIKKIAIDDFTDLNGHKSALGDFISEELVTSFYTLGAGSFDVVERRELARVLKEQKLGGTGLLNKETIAKVGKILGIDAIVTGSISYLGRSIKINARMIGVNDARVFAAAARKVPKDEVVESLLGQSARAEQSSGQVTPYQAVPADVQIQSHRTQFQNKFLVVTPKIINISKSKQSVSLALDFKNITTNDLLLMVDNGYSGHDHNHRYVEASVMSDQGAMIDRHVGKVFVMGLTSYSNSGDVWKRKDNFTVIAPSSMTTVIFRFTGNQKIDGNLFSFSANMVRLNGKTYERFSLGIPNIRLPKQADGESE